MGSHEENREAQPFENNFSVFVEGKWAESEQLGEENYQSTAPSQGFRSFDLCSARHLGDKEQVVLPIHLWLEWFKCRLKRVLYSVLEENAPIRFDGIQLIKKFLDFQIHVRIHYTGTYHNYTLIKGVLNWAWGLLLSNKIYLEVASRDSFYLIEFINTLNINWFDCFLFNYS